MSIYSIGNISKLTDIPAKTIRFYEEEKLLSKVSRKENNYRIYNSQNIEELKVIRYARSLGFSLSQIRTLLHSPDKLTDYLNDLKDQTQKEINSLQTIKKNLDDIESELKQSKCTCTNNNYCCNIFMSILKQKAKGGDKNNDL